MKQLLFIVFALFSLSGCAELDLASHMAKRVPGVNAGAQQGLFKVGDPYKVEGKWYTPSESYSFTETGIASWYGPQFHGKQTANGEVFDMNELTAAHRTLQMPSLVRVTNLENGRSLIVRINDRGPFKRGRVIDLSKRAAELLGFKSIGTAKVKIQLLPEESKKIAELAKRGKDTSGIEVAMNEQGLAGRPGETIELASANIQDTSTPTSLAPAPVESEVLHTPNFKGHIKNGVVLPDPIVHEVPVMPTNIYIQAGSFSEQPNAAHLAQMLQKYANAQVYPAVVNGRPFYRVRLGPIADVVSADSILAQLARDGQPQAITVVE